MMAQNTVWFSFGFFFILLSTTFGRETMDLSRDWQGVWVEGRSSGQSPPANGWAAVEFPVHNGGKCLWLKRTLTMEDRWSGRRVALWFQQVNYRTEVHVNGQSCGIHDGGFGSFEIEIHRFLKPKQPNEILVAISGPPVNGEGRSPDAVGYGTAWAWGVFGPVELRVTEITWIHDAFLVPSVRKKNLTVTVETGSAEGTPKDLSFQCVIRNAEGKMVLQSERGKVDSPLRIPWSAPRLWTPDDPYLYRVEVQLLHQGQIIDQILRPLGFREFWCDGPHFMLNGRRINLRGDGWHWRSWSRDQIRQLFRLLKSTGINVYRGHGPHEEVWLEVADEMGMLLVAEGPFYQMQNTDVGHPQFWPNARRTLTEWVRRVRNHPSVVIYSANNEVVNGYESMGGYAREKEAAHAKSEPVQWVLQFERIIRDADPTRPVTHEGDGQLTARDDIVNIHYPHEAPFWNLYPDTTYWVKTSPGDCAWKYKPWDGRRPFYIGEFGKNFEASPRTAAMTAGEAAYADIDGYYRGLGEIMRQAIIGFRASDVAGIAPWNTSTYAAMLDASNRPVLTELYKKIAEGFKPQAVFLREYNTRFFGRNEYTRTLQIFNDSLTDAEYAIDWSLGNQKGSERIRLAAGNHLEKPIRLSIPDVTEPVSVPFVVEMKRDGRPVDRFERRFSIFPRGRLKKIARECLVFDPAGQTIRRLREGGVRFKPIDSLAIRQADQKTVLIGEDALTEKVARACEALARQGAHVIVLSQKSWPARWMGVAAAPSACTIGFTLRADHPYLQGLAGDDLCYWAGNHVVARRLLLKPAGGPVNVLAETAGDQLGLKFMLLGQGRIGRGLVTLVQLDVIEKLCVEPAAEWILANLIEQAVPATPFVRTKVLAKSAEFKKLAVEAGLTPSAFGTDLSPDDRLVVVEGKGLGDLAPEKVRQIQAMVRQGGTAFVTAVESKDLKNLQLLLDANPKIVTRDFFQLIKNLPALELDGISNDDLCWVIYDEWGSEYRNRDNKRWPIVSHPFEAKSLNGKVLLIPAKVVFNGMYCGDGISREVPKGFDFPEKDLAAMAEIPLGRGRVILCQIRWDVTDPDQANQGPFSWDRNTYSHQNTRRRILAAFLINLGAEVKPAEKP